MSKFAVQNSSLYAQNITSHLNKLSKDLNDENRDPQKNQNRDIGHAKGKIVSKQENSKPKSSLKPLESMVQIDSNKKSADPMDIVDLKWEDIDTNDTDDPQALTEYVNEIYEHLMKKERSDMIPVDFLEKQTDINEKMRAILVDWLVEVHRMFKLIPETLFLSVNIIDRYLKAKSVPRDKLQLVGITAMLISSKYEEIYAPESNDFVYISDGAFTKDQILALEQQMLNTLSFNFLHPAPLHFLRRYSKAAGSDYTIHTLCKYLIELVLLDTNFRKYLASETAAASVYLARVMSKKTPVWTGTLEHYSTYSEQHIRPIAFDMNEFLKKYQKSSLKALRKKYSSPKFGEVADIPLVELSIRKDS